MFVARALNPFSPSGMTKSGTQTFNVGSWTPLTSWSADTTNYPGSSVASDQLVMQGNKASVTLTANVAFTGGTLNVSHQCRIVDQSGNVLATGSAVSANSGTCTASYTGSLVGVTSIGVQIISGNASYGGTVTAGATTFLQIT